MKKLIILAVLMMAGTSLADGFLQADGNGQRIQGPAPNVYLQQILTANSTTIDLSGTLWWGLYAPTACKYRLLPTAANSFYPSFTVQATTPISQVIATGTKFLNLSGCALAELSRM